MTVLSLFDGISCGKVALDRAGIKYSAYYASEIDKYAIQVSNQNHPDIIRLGDVRNIDTTKLPKIDLLIGGSPCQSFSRSGDNSGFNGKSGLFYEYLRILRETKPTYFLLENVVMKKEWESQISNLLGVSPIMIDSANFSAQKRQRLYWTNIPINPNVSDQGIKLSDIFMGGQRNIIDGNPVVLKIDKGIFWIRNATKQGYLIAKDGDCVNLEMPLSKTRRGRVSREKTNTLNTACNYGFIWGGHLLELNITEYERLQTLPDGYTNGIPLSQRKKVIGNGWTVEVIRYIFSHLKDKRL